jgi:hypothetical protein
MLLCESSPAAAARHRLYFLFHIEDSQQFTKQQNPQTASISSNSLRKPQHMNLRTTTLPYHCPGIQRKISSCLLPLATTAKTRFPRQWAHRQLARTVSL